ncbi:MAG: hypothetical protein WA192_02520 [Candidatus Acidiferrales bacterium]
MSLQIAVGILLVILAVLIVYNNPNWLPELSGEGRAERAIYTLTPDVVIARRGTPISDNTEEFPGVQGMVTVFHNMLYNGGSGTVVLTFVRSDEKAKKGRWVLNAMNVPVSHFRYGSGKAKLVALPCLEGR